MRFNGDTPRIRLDLTYSDTFFPGWAAQSGLRTVEGVLISALATVLREPIRFTAAGRVDASVHAVAQVAHLDVSPEAWVALPGCSQRLPEAALFTRVAGVLTHEAQESLTRTPCGASDVVVTGAYTMSEVFDSRFGALSHRYTYRIADATAPHGPTRRATVLWPPDALDVEAMDASTRTPLDEHDFLSYYKPREGATTIHILCTLRWRWIGVGPDVEPESGLVTLNVVTGAFCHSMVRSLVETGLAVERGYKPVTWPREFLDARTHQSAAPVTPPHGLALGEVIYPADDELAAQAERARTTRCLNC